MDVEQRSGQLFSSEISASFIGLPISNNRHMNQFHNQKSKLQKQRKSGRNVNKPTRRTPTFEVLPKIESTKSTSPETMTSSLNQQKSQSSNNNSFTISDKFQKDLPVSDISLTNNVQEWLQMPTPLDILPNSYVQQHPNLSRVSSESEELLTCVGEFTDRTSVTSSEWGDDVCEFDKKESHRVNQMFEEIQWMLFNDGNSLMRMGSNRSNQSSSFSDRNGLQSGPLHLKRECSEWTNQFPHFRLIGHQVSSPQEQGFVFHETDTSGSVTPKNSPRILVDNSSIDSDFIISKSVPGTSDVDSLNYKMSLVGSSIKLDSAGQDKYTEELDLFSSQEEVFVTDGEIVEIIAIDYKMDDEDFNMVNQKKSHSHNSLFRSHKGYPPITPNAVMRDAVLTAVFDNLWSQVVEWILPLLSKMYQSYACRDTLTLELSDHNPSHGMTIADGFKYPKPLSHIGPISINNLDNILRISTKTLQFREKSYLQSIPEQSQNTTSVTKSSLNSTTGASRQPIALVNYPKKLSKISTGTDRSQTPLSTQESSFILDKDYKRSSLVHQPNFITASNLEHLSPLQCLRGRALYNCQSPDMISRCGTLPPINNRYHITSNLRSTGSRIGSAQMQNNHNQSISIGNTSIANQILLSSEFANTRPCTSQTARSDLGAGNRSSTPNGNRRSLNLNVHGSSITMNSFSMKGTDDLPYENFKHHSKTRPYWKIYNNPVPAPNKRNKSLSNSVK